MKGAAAGGAAGGYACFGPLPPYLAVPCDVLPLDLCGVVAASWDPRRWHRSLCDVWELGKTHSVSSLVFSDCAKIPGSLSIIKVNEEQNSLLYLKVLFRGFRNLQKSRRRCSVCPQSRVMDECGPPCHGPQRRAGWRIWARWSRWPARVAALSPPPTPQPAAVLLRCFSQGGHCVFLIFFHRFEGHGMLKAPRGSASVESPGQSRGSCSVITCRSSRAAKTQFQNNFL